MVSKYVDSFFGNGEIQHPVPHGIAATWFFIKAQCGNTHPHATLPFGKMSCGLYTGGYPTGYGNHCPNSCGPVKKFSAPVRGFSHLHQSGTGAIGAYYNYAVVSPVYGDISYMDDAVLSEQAHPGYYSAKLKSGIFAELTTDKFCAIHRYHLDKKTTITIDFSNDGLERTFDERYYGLAKNGTVSIEDNGAISASVTLQGIPTYFYAVCEGEVEKTFLFEDFKELSNTIINKGDIEERWGGAFTVLGDCVIKLAVSHKSIEEAKKRVGAADDFDTTKKMAESIWEEYLGRIEIDADVDIKELFYSNFYHSIIKPALYEDGTYTDFATLWDMYKTQLPLVYSLFQEESLAIVKTLLLEGKRYGKVPTGLMLWDKVHHFDNQAQLLSVYTMADAYYRGLVSGRDVIEHTLGESKGDPDELLKELLENEKYTHILDLTDACGVAADIAKTEGDIASAEQFEKVAQKWSEAFSAESGLLRESTKYYEGNSHSYSFRLQRNMEERIKLCGSTENFLKIVDNFFGYGQPPVEQCKVSEDWRSIEKIDLRRFDGINNEHDLESPFVYLYAGRHDRLCEVVSGIQKYMFAKGKGGLPGNNDTGALSSWYVWNAMGLFPVTGQNKILVTNPLIRTAKIHLLNGNTFTIKVEGKGEYVDFAELNGIKCSNFTFSLSDMLKGGELVIKKKI